MSWPCPHWCPWPPRALEQQGLFASATEGLCPHGPEPRPKWASPGHGHSHATLQLLAHHVGRGQVLMGITDGAPGQAASHLQAPSAGVLPTCQPGLHMSWKRRQMLSRVRCCQITPQPGATTHGPWEAPARVDHLCPAVHLPSTGQEQTAGSPSSLHPEQSRSPWSEGRSPAAGAPLCLATSACPVCGIKNLQVSEARSRHTSSHRALPPGGHQGEWTVYLL